MAQRLKFEQSNDIGCFVKVTNNYCLIAPGTEVFKNTVRSTFGDKMPIIELTIAGMNIIGRMTAGNKNGLLVPMSTTEEEMAVLRAELPEGVKI